MFCKHSKSGISFCPLKPKSKYHRLAEAGWDLTQPLLKKGHPEQGDQGHVQAEFGDLQGGDSTASLASMSQCSTVCTVRKCFLVFGWNFLYSSLFPLPLLLAWIALKRSCLRLFCTLPLGLCAQPLLPQLSLGEKMLQSYNHFSGPSLDSLQQLYVSLALGSQELSTALQA